MPVITNGGLNFIPRTFSPVGDRIALSAESHSAETFLLDRSHASFDVARRKQKALLMDGNRLGSEMPHQGLRKSLKDGLDDMLGGAGVYPTSDLHATSGGSTRVPLAQS